MAIAAGVVGVLEGSALEVVAGVEAPSQRRGPAPQEIEDDFPSVGREPSAEGVLEVFEVMAEDRRQLGHCGSGPLHLLLDGSLRAPPDLPGHVGVAGGGLDVGVTEEPLDHLERDSGLEQMGGDRVAQGVDGDRLVHAARPHCLAEGAAEAVSIHVAGVGGDRVLEPVSGRGGESQTGERWIVHASRRIRRVFSGRGTKRSLPRLPWTWRRRLSRSPITRPSS